jgi:T-complex protein 1 subunit delta
MDRILKEERKYILDLIKKITSTGCNVLLIQKSILRDAVNELALHFLAKKNIMVIKDIDRDQIEFISKTTGAIPVAHVDHFTNEKLGSAGLVEEVATGGERKIVKVTGCPT